MVRKAVYGGRTEPYENLFEPMYRSRCGGCAHPTKRKRDCADCAGCGDCADCGECEWTELASLLEDGKTDFDLDRFNWDLYYYDLTSQYPSEMLCDLPCGKGRWATRAELDAVNADPSRIASFLDCFYGFLKVDVVVNKTHPVWARYPVLPERKPVHGAETLVWDCEDKKGNWCVKKSKNAKKLSKLCSGSNKAKKCEATCELC